MIYKNIKDLLNQFEARNLLIIVYNNWLILLCVSGTIFADFLIAFLCYDPCFYFLLACPIYKNIDLEKSKILLDNKGLSGIYLLSNLIDGKKYVGSAIDLSKRLSFYFSESKMNCALQQGKSYICSAILSHKLENFSLTIIEYCKVSELLAREKYYINLLKSEYNIIQDPTIPPMLGRSHLEESKQKISNSKKGRKLTSENIAKISAALKGKNHPFFGKKA